jgi:acetyl esterase/lipase
LSRGCYLVHGPRTISLVHLYDKTDDLETNRLKTFPHYKALDRLQPRRMSQHDSSTASNSGALKVAHPPFDSAYKALSSFAAAPAELNVQAARKVHLATTADTILAKLTNVKHREVIAAPVQDLSESPVTLALFESKTSQSKNRAVVLYCHGGGQVAGTRFFGVEMFLNMMPMQDDFVLASVEYRLAPEHRAPAGAYDCYTASVYLTENAAELGIDASKIVLYGISGGAGPAAATCILARERQYPSIRAQMLVIPMLDDRDTDAAHKQFPSGTNWTAVRNQAAWDMVLGSDRSALTDLQVPGRAKDLTNLPPAFIDVGECDVLRDSAVAYASRLWSHGGSCELHVWPGMYHGGHAFEPEVPVSKSATAAERDFLERVLGFERNVSDVVREGVTKSAL